MATVHHHHYHQQPLPQANPAWRTLKMYMIGAAAIGALFVYGNSLPRPAVSAPAPIVVTKYLPAPVVETPEVAKPAVKKVRTAKKVATPRKRKAKTVTVVTACCPCHC
jgi:hypothetical protein